MTPREAQLPTSARGTQVATGPHETPTTGVSHAEQHTVVTGVPLPTVPLKAYPMNAGMSHEDFLERFNKVLWIKQNLMKEGTHFGLIPKVGDKPSLFQPGAQMLNIIFQHAPSYKRDVQPIGDDYLFNIDCTLTHFPTGLVVGAGMGGGSTGEKRFQKKDTLDVYNSALKMTAKRAYVAATISCTGVSELFTQDIEDNPELYTGEVPQSAPAPTGNGRPQRDKMPGPPSRESRFETVLEKVEYIAKDKEWWGIAKGLYFWTKDASLGESMLELDGVRSVIIGRPSQKHADRYQVLEIGEAK
jgi:hypothetical protein